MTQNDLSVVGATQIVVGLSAITKITPTAYQYSYCLKIFAGGGTLEIVPPPLALSGTSAVGWGTGYAVGANESVNISGPAIFYLAATGATMTVSSYFGRTFGASLAV